MFLLVTGYLYYFAYFISMEQEKPSSTADMYAQFSSFPESERGEILHAFSAPEFVERPRGVSWFLGMGIGVVCGVLIGIFQGSLSLILVSVMVGAIYTLTHNQPIKTVRVVFSKMGVEWNDQFFLYQDVKNFWIFWEPGQEKTLHLFTTKGRNKEIVIPIQSQKMEVIRDVLGYYVPELEGVQEPLPNVISRALKL